LLGGGIMVACIEIIGNVIIGRFPGIIIVLPSNPLPAIIINALAYSAIIFAAGLIIGAVVELARRIFWAGFSAQITSAGFYPLGFGWFYCRVCFFRSLSCFINISGR